MPTDIEIAHSVEPWPIQQVAEAAGVDRRVRPYSPRARRAAATASPVS